MRELAREILAGEDAWVVGGAVRDELLGRPLVDLDVACRDPLAAAQAYRRRSRGAVFPLSERHGAWRVALEDGRTVDFTPLRDGIEDDLATRDFTVNAVAVPLAGGRPVDPFGGLQDLEAKSVRAVRDTVFSDDPLRLLRAVRMEDELRFRLDSATEALVRAHAPLVTTPAGERVYAELVRLSPGAFRRLAELGLLEQLGGSLERWSEGLPREVLLVAVFGRSLERLPIPNDTRRLARTLLRARAPEDASPRSVHRFRRTTEPWALEALAFLGRRDLEEAVLAARASEPAEPLVRGDELARELDLAPGPEIGWLLDRIEEERAAGTVGTRQEALRLARREQGVNTR